MEKPLAICSAPQPRHPPTTNACHCWDALCLRSASSHRRGRAYTEGMRASLAAVALAVVSLSVIAGIVQPISSVDAAGKERRFTSTKYGLTVDAPSGWTLSLHTGYPNILAVLLHPSGSRISIAASETSARVARDLAEQNRPGLEAQGLAVLTVVDAAHQGILVDAQSRTHDDRVRQYYLVRTIDKTHQAVIVTLTTKKDFLPTISPALDIVIAKMITDAPLQAGPDAGANH
ncbi:MAG TPA: hypothetical protein VNO55_00655 [Polyangia bacterium]|nr:hypothetical protein [Polyangia bacterium]